MICSTLAGTAASTFQLDTVDIKKELGNGQFGKVHYVVHKTTNEAAAMKVVNPKMEKEEMEVLDEIKTLEFLNSIPNINIIKMWSHQKLDSGYHIFLELGDVCLIDLIDDCFEKDGRMEYQLMKKLFGQLVQAVEHLHKSGIVHRDLKTENLLVNKNDILKVTDFGLAAKYVDNNIEKLFEHGVGTYAFCAPEELSTDSFFGPPTDVWAIGCILVEMLTGNVPWKTPIKSDKMYSEWARGDLRDTRWRRIKDRIEFALPFLERVLAEIPRNRFNITQLASHPFCGFSATLPNRKRTLINSTPEPQMPPMKCRPPLVA